MDDGTIRLLCDAFISSICERIDELEESQPQLFPDDELAERLKVCRELLDSILATREDVHE